MSRRIGAVVAIVVVLVAIGIGAFVFMGKRAARAASVAAASLSHCLLGGPLAAGEDPELRLHRIALGGPPADWPKRCERYATELAAALDRAGRKSDAADVRSRWSNGFELTRIELEPESFVIPALDPSVEPAPDVPAAPPPASAPDDGAALLAEKTALAGSTSDPVPGAGLNVVLGKSRLCRFAKDLDTASCAPLGKNAPTGAQGFLLWPPGEVGGSVWVTDHLLPDNRVQRFFRADTGTLFDARKPDRAVYAHAYGEDRFVTLGPSDEPAGGWKLMSWTGAKHGEPKELDLSFKRLGLFSDRLLWIARADDDLDHLMSATLTPEPLALGKPVDHGALEVTPDAIEGCRTKDSLAVVLSRGSDARVMFFAAEGVSPQHRAKLRADAQAGARVLACGSDDVTLTRVVSVARRRTDRDATGYLVQHARCTKAGCDATEVELDAMLGSATDVLRPTGTRTGDVVAAGLGGKLLVVWRSATRGVRARLAEPQALTSAPDILLFDDGVTAGRRVVAGSVFAMSLFPRYEAAALLLELTAERGVVGLRVGADGKVQVIAPKG